jgi:hypothetical protein
VVGAIERRGGKLAQEILPGGFRGRSRLRGKDSHGSQHK